MGNTKKLTIIYIYICGDGAHENSTLISKFRDIFI